MPVRKKLKTDSQELEGEEFLTITVPLDGYVLEDVTHLILHEPPTTNVGYKVPSPQKRSRPAEKENDTESDIEVIETSTPNTGKKGAEDSSDVCDVCNKTFKTPYALRRHKLDVHPTSPLCDDCADTMRKPTPFRAVQSSFNCSRCGKYQAADLTPKEVTSKRGSLPWGNTCPYCDKTLSDPFNIKRHIVQVHKVALPEVDSAIALWRKENRSLISANREEVPKSVPLADKDSSEADTSSDHPEEQIIGGSAANGARKSFPLSKKKTDERAKLSRKSLPAVANVSKDSPIQTHELPPPQMVFDPSKPGVTMYMCPYCEKSYGDINRHLNRFHRVSGYKNWELTGKVSPKKPISKNRDKCPYCSVPVIKLDVHLNNFHKDEIEKEKEKAKEEMDSSAEDFSLGAVEDKEELPPKTKSKTPFVALKKKKKKIGRPIGSFKTQDSPYKRQMMKIRGLENVNQEEKPEDSQEEVEVKPSKTVEKKPTDALSRTPRILKKDLPNFAIIEEIANDPVLSVLFPYPCTYCNKTYKENNRLLKHLKTHKV